MLGTASLKSAWCWSVSLELPTFTEYFLCPGSMLEPTQPHLRESLGPIVASRELCWGSKLWYLWVPWFRKGLCRHNQVKVRWLEWTQSTGVLIGRQTHTREKLCDDRGRGWSAVPGSWGVPGTVGNHQEKQGRILPAGFRGSTALPAPPLWISIISLVFKPPTLWCCVTATL